LLPLVLQPRLPRWANAILRDPDLGRASQSPNELPLFEPPVFEPPLPPCRVSIAVVDAAFGAGESAAERAAATRPP